MPLIVTGGDGALFHQLQKLSVPFPEIAIVPNGRGNALARDLRHLPAPVAVDLMEVEVTPASGAPYRRLCGSSVAFGYPVLVTRLAESLRPLRRLSYAAASAAAWPTPQDFRIGYQGGPLELRRLTGILVNNTRHVGGFIGFPEASCQDGLADVMELRSNYPSQMLHNVTSILRMPVWRPARFLQVRQAEIHAPEPQELMLDGELIAGIASVRVTILPGVLLCQAL